MKHRFKLWENRLTKNQIVKLLNQKAKSILDYRKNYVFGFPGTTPHAIGIYAQHIFAPFHANNVMTHTRGFTGKRFIETIEFEKEVIHMTADLFSANAEKIDGYITTGGTEANITGMWIGRNKLIHESGKNNVAVFCSFLTHYSIQKACNLLQIGDTYNSKDGSGLRLIETDDNGHILLGRLSDAIEESVSKGITNFIIIGNLGTTLLGSIDDLSGINKLINDYKMKYPFLHFYFHVDAAFGGFIVPFMDNLPEYGFELSNLCSIAIDPHKAGFVPFSCGIFICRKNLQNYITHQVGYIAGHKDDTLSGSRSGSIAAACWSVYKILGYEGYKKRVNYSINLANYLKKNLEKMGFCVFENDMNVITLKHPSKLSKKIIDKYVIVQDSIPSSLNDLASKLITIDKFAIMPHIKKRQIQEFLRDISRKYGKAQS